MSTGGIGIRGRRRTLMGVTVVVAIGCFALPAYASDTIYRGTVTEQSHASVRFHLIKKANGAVFVQPFTLKHVRAKCTLGPNHITISKYRFHRIPVEGDAFHASHRPSDLHYQVTGHLQRHDKAKGRLEVTEEAALCDSGALHWQAAG